jgi:hypothetical protein
MVSANKHLRELFIVEENQLTLQSSLFTQEIASYMKHFRSNYFKSISFSNFHSALLSMLKILLQKIDSLNP